MFLWYHEIERVELSTSFYLLLFFVLQFECRFDALPFVQKSPPHVDLTDVSDVETDEVEGDVVNCIRCSLAGHNKAGHIDVLKWTITF